ncbi:MAG TPA: helicase-associated domain-containing protein [Deltaproteobacteria bacterium]|nr:helicase-associated domain-containing protein [Deltaproteobacteria bacterium]
MTSTHDLIASIPSYMIPVISQRILGNPADQRALAEGLSDTDRLEKVLAGLTDKQRDILLNLHELGEQVGWDILGRTHGCPPDELRADLEELGTRGLVFQGGLSGRDPVILLPSLASLMDAVKAQYSLPVEDIEWLEPKRQSLWGHITMANALLVGRIRCKAGIEPFKKGWEYLEQKLSAVLDVRRIYWELAELSCLREKNGQVALVQRAVAGLALEGDARYGLWRFCQSCKPFPGLDFQVFATISDKGVKREFLSRSLSLWVASRDETLENARSAIESLLELWLDLGVLQQDASGQWIRLSAAAWCALKTGRTEAATHHYSEEAIIQPTMEILVPFDFDTVDLLNVGEVADLVQADMMSIYRLTRESVFRALQEGWSVERIMGFLERISRHSLPENVRVNIAGWARLHTEAHIIKGTFLVLSGEKAAVPKGLEEVLPGIFRIPERCEEEIASFLEKKGVMIRCTEGLRDSESDIDWGKPLPLKGHQRTAPRVSQKEGVYPFGMVMPLPYGPRREMLFEEALHENRTLIIFYPRQGYGEIQARKVSPMYIFRRSGMPFMEAYCEDTGEGEVFDISKVRAIFRQQ